MSEDSKKLQIKPKHAWRVGVGAGILGAIVVALKYALRPPTKRRVPDTISPAVFATKVLHTTLGQVVYHESGSGRPLVFLHNVGLGASSYEWSKVYPHFADRYRVLALDLVGFGESARPVGRYAAADYVRMLAELLRALNWEQPPIIVASGLSAGFAVHLAASHPELVARLILHMPTGSGELGRHVPSFFTRLLYRSPLVARFIYRNHLATKSSMATWLRKVAFLRPEFVTDEILDVLTTCAQQPSAEYAALSWLGGSMNFDLEARLASLPQPVALLWGDDPVVSAEAPLLRLQKALPTSSVTVISGVGIMAALEAPAEMVAALDDQLLSELRVLKAS